MLYRMRRDVHAQLPPDSMSVSLNILGADPAQPWLDQYRFDLERGTIAEGLTVTAAEALVAIAIHIGNGLDLAERFARSHPSPRMRVTALDALASALPDEAPALFARAAGDPDRFVSGHARARLAP